MKLIIKGIFCSIRQSDYWGLIILFPILLAVSFFFPPDRFVQTMALVVCVLLIFLLCLQDGNVKRSHAELKRAEALHNETFAMLKEQSARLKLQ